MEIYDHIMDEAQTGRITGPDAKEQLNNEGLDEYGNFKNAKTDFEQWKTANPEHVELERETREYNRSYC